jgi:hypothetical protein
MKRFQFGPEKVRQWRDKQAEVEELKLQHLHSEREGLVLQQESIQFEAKTADDAVRIGNHINAEDLANLDSFKLFVRVRSSQLEAQKKHCDIRIAQQQKLAIAARRAAELHDRLKTRRFDEWKTACDKEQENLSNELFLAKRYIRKT